MDFQLPGSGNYVISQKGQEKGAAIVYDSRRMSPELSFAVRELGCICGIVITASHNPREYNGYKVYWEDGAQITPAVP